MTEPGTIEKSDKQTKSIWREMSKIWTLLGIIVAAASLSSLIQRWFGVPMAEYPDTILGYYRSVADQLKLWLFDWWIARLLPIWAVPNWLFDLMLLWTAAGLSSYRGMAKSFESYNAHYSKFRSTYQLKIPNPLRLMFMGPVALFKSIKLAIVDLTTIRRERLLTESNPNIDPELGIVHSLQPTFQLIFYSLSPILVTVIFFTWNGLAL